MVGGAEDKEKSRRVVFRVDFSDAETLEGIGREVEGEAAASGEKLTVLR